jgi:hypothetical protein
VTDYALRFDQALRWLLLSPLATIVGNRRERRVCSPNGLGIVRVDGNRHMAMSIQRSATYVPVFGPAEWLPMVHATCLLWGFAQMPVESLQVLRVPNSHHALPLLQAFRRDASLHALVAGLGRWRSLFPEEGLDATASWMATLGSLRLIWNAF